MPFAILILAAGPSLAMLCLGLLPGRWANRSVTSVRQLAMAMSGLHLLTALAITAQHLWQSLGGTSAPSHASSFGGLLLLDGNAILVLGLVAFVGFAVCRYSVRYLDGDPQQGRFFSGISMTLGAVSFVVMSGNLAMLFLAWVLTSLGLHRLLVHYSDRPAARRTAGQKFVLSRVADLALLSAFFLTYRAFGTLQLTEIYGAVQAPGFQPTVQTSLICWLVILGAALKSAQFPFHFWLPDTLETPTPVSALMHAGIVNAGGYLVIRLSPLLLTTPAALSFLAMLGATTIAYAGVVMMTQSSVKRSLAYSTVAQMGFMMLQCGLGAFTAALLHILAHSLYKAYSFLNSGNVLNEAIGQRQPATDRKVPLRGVDYAGAFLMSAAAVLVTSACLGLDLSKKPGGLLLGLLLALALASWLGDVFRMKARRVTITGIATTLGLAGFYMGCFALVDRLAGWPAASQPLGIMSVVATVYTLFIFSGLFCFTWLLRTQSGRRTLGPLYVHAANGFYVDAIARRLLPIPHRF